MRASLCQVTALLHLCRKKVRAGPDRIYDRILNHRVHSFSAFFFLFYFFLPFFFLAFLAAPPAAAQDVQPGDSCSHLNQTVFSGGPEGGGRVDFLRCNGTIWELQLTFEQDGNVGIGHQYPEAALDVAGGVRMTYDTAPCNTGKSGTIRYVSAGSPPWEYCDGSAWSPFKQPRCQDNTAGECYLAGTRSDSDPEFTAANIKSGVNILGVTGTLGAAGWFVQSATRWNGNLGGLAGANLKCLTELQNLDWKGKAAAGVLTGARVKAFLCTGSACNNLMPNSFYYMAQAGDAAAGGQALYTDASGLGPGAQWYWDVNGLNSTYNAWTNRGTVSGDYWAATPKGSGHCANWTSASSGSIGRGGNAGWSDARRWDDTNDNCNVTNFLYCFVDP